MKTQTKFNLAGSALLCAGLAITLPAVYFWHHNQVSAATPKTYVAVKSVAPAPTAITGKPSSIHIPSLKLNLPVADGIYNQKNGEWSLSLSKAHYALITPQPNNEQGNTLIYGHYRPEVFAYLHHIMPGAEVAIETENNLRFVYTFDSSKAVDPADTSIFSYQGSPILTIQTCSGAFMQNRQMYKFNFVRYEKI